VGGGGYDRAGLRVQSPADALLAGRHRALVERAEDQFRTSALLLRANGRTEHARRAQQYADWARLHLIEPQATRALYRVLTDSLPATLLAERILELALDLLNADQGNVQIADAETGALTIAAHRGFGTEFLEYFAVVTDTGSACGRAAHEHAQIVIPDVGIDPGFAAHRDIAAASGFCAVQSTPLTSADGRLIGMVSTHYPRAADLPDMDLPIIRCFGTLIGDKLSGLINYR